MSAACVCPDVDVPLSPVPVGPILCACCGRPLELTCAGQCGEAHVRASFAAAAPAYVNTGRIPAPKASKPTASKVTPRPLGPWVCVRCTGPIPKKHGRSPLYCAACLTPDERARLEELGRQNQAARERRAALRSLVS